MNALLSKNLWFHQNENPILCFLHLPRTGGSTLNRVLKYAFQDRAIFHADLLVEHGGEAGLSAAFSDGQAIYGKALIFGLALGGTLPRCNERPVMAGIAPARSQPDYATALARLEGCNRAELDFFARLPPIFASMPKPILAATGAA